MTAPDLARRHVVVEVPASIANLGAGYDCLGIAVGLTLTVTVDVLLAADALAGVPMAGANAAEWRARLLDRATTMEGHSDNVAPALLGGFVASLAPRAFRFDAPSELRIVLLVPELRLSTAR